RSQTTIEELENTNQDLLSLNEELHSTNEELQSTNEELETSNEELQAANEELITLNEELEIKTTELSKANAAVKESEARFRALFENIPVAISLTREDGAILAFNSAYQDLLGYSADELHTLNAAQLYNRPQERQAILEKIKRQDTVHKTEVEFKRKNQQTFIAQLTVTPFAINGTTAMLTVLQDITDRKKAMADLRKSEAALAEALAWGCPWYKAS
ncbi:MAG: PAS domain S-box protein, partial [Desulfobacteraceae bacterium]|nr:PAS domain S-box protein [Desulfobacteraceae bacterium]